MFFIIYLKLLFKVIKLLSSSKINIKITTLCIFILFLWTALILIIYLLYFYNYDIHVIESNNAIYYFSDIIDNKNEFIKQQDINPYNKLYGIFNFNKYKLNIPVIELQDIYANKYLKTEINFESSNTYKDILKLADYRYTSLRHDIFNILNESLKMIK
jgi:hypothetical protein